MEAPGHVPSVPSPKSGTVTNNVTVVYLNTRPIGHGRGRVALGR